MFQFSPLAPRSLWIQQRVTRHDSRRVSPFGHPRINAYVRLPEAFRSLSRPSSPVRAKASTVRPCSLDRIIGARLASRGSSAPPIPDHAWCSRVSLDDTTPNPTPGFSMQSEDRGVLDAERRQLSSAFDRSEGRLTRGSRKEVIQPQVPLRLPCYDFAPVTELAFGGSLPCGLGHRLRALPTPMA